MERVCWRSVVRFFDQLQTMAYRPQLGCIWSGIRAAKREPNIDEVLGRGEPSSRDSPVRLGSCVVQGGNCVSSRMEREEDGLGGFGLMFELLQTLTVIPWSFMEQSTSACSIMASVGGGWIPCHRFRCRLQVHKGKVQYSTIHGCN